MTVSAEQFKKLNLIAGTVRSLEQKPLVPADMEVFDRDFDWIVKNLNKVDRELGTEFAGEKDFYLAACQVAKGYFNDKPFGGLKSSSGQFGMNMIAPQHLKSAASGTLKYYDWSQTITTDSADTDADILGGSTGSVDLYAESTAEEKEVIAFHTLISYKPSPRVIALEVKVNDVPYPPHVVDIFSRIEKPDKLFKFLPLPGRIVIHPGGKFYIRGWFDCRRGATAPTGTQNIDIEIAPFGLTFAEYAQFAIANIT